MLPSWLADRLHGDAGLFEAGARIFAARSSEPGVSPCTQMVVGFERHHRAVDGDDRRDPSPSRTARATTAAASWMTAPGLRRETSEPSGS